MTHARWALVLSLAIFALLSRGCGGASGSSSMTPARVVEPEHTEASTRRDVTFRSGTAELRGWLYLPAGRPRFSLVIMSHGFSATRRMTADQYAEHFRAAGLAVLLYDHRGFGDSGGEPRLQINPWVQAREYLDAFAYARTLPEIDGEHIGLWGDSFSGGVALAVAGIDHRVAALVIQVPAIGSELPPDDPDGARRKLFEETILAGPIEPSGPDEVEGPMPVVSEDQVRRPSALTPLTACRWFMEYGGRPGSGWVNEVTRARPKTRAPWQPALAAAAVTCPAQFLVSPDDEMRGSRPAVARAAYEKIAGEKEWIDIEGGHFGLIYVPSPEFNRAVREQTRFFLQHIGRSAR